MLCEKFFVVALAYQGEVIEVNRSDGNPFPYSTKAAARSVANREQALARKIKGTIQIPLISDDGTVEIVDANPRGFRYFVRDWLSLREVI